MLNCWCITWPVGFKRLNAKSFATQKSVPWLFLYMSKEHLCHMNKRQIKTLNLITDQSIFTWAFSPMAQQPQCAKASSLSRLHCRTQTHHTRYDSSGRVIGPTQRPLPDNTQHSQHTDIHAPGGIWTWNPSASEMPQTHPLDSAATGISNNAGHLHKLPTPRKHVILDTWLRGICIFSENSRSSN